MEEKKKKKITDTAPAGDPEQIIKGTEADTEDIVDFMHEEIKKRPVNRRKILRRARETMLTAVLFGVVSCIVFAILLPIINNILTPGEKQAETVKLPEATVSEELTPEEMVEKEKEREATEEKKWIREELEGILDDKIVGVEQHRRISSSLQELAADCSSMLVTVSGITSDMDWFNNSYENRNTVSGLVTKKTGTDIYVLVQSRRIEDSKKIMVTFSCQSGNIEAEAEKINSDPATGLTILSVPVSEIPVRDRAGILEAGFGSSAGPIITGAPVIAVGSPTGKAGSVIYGNVTGADDSLEVPDNDICRLTTDIYGGTDATGFLINLDGEVVGMIDMRFRDSNVPNMLCAIGISELRPIIRRMENGRKKSVLGICGINVTDEISEMNDIPVGVWVTRVMDDSPAMAAGIQKGDVITGFDKSEILHMAGLITKLEETEPGQNVTLRIMRRRGDEFEELKVSAITQQE